MSRAPITLSEYDPEWPQRFEDEKQFLLGIVGAYLCGSIEHVGSTAVPGLVAKPVIDIMFGVNSLSRSAPAIEIITAAGYEYSSYKMDVMHWFCKPSDAHRTHHLHLIPYESALWKERIIFRDLLRSDIGVASAYSALKVDLAVRYEGDRETYTQEKWPFIQQALGLS